MKEPPEMPELDWLDRLAAKAFGIPPEKVVWSCPCGHQCTILDTSVNLETGGGPYCPKCGNDDIAPRHSKTPRLKLVRRTHGDSTPQ